MVHTATPRAMRSALQHKFVFRRSEVIQGAVERGAFRIDCASRRARCIVSLAAPLLLGKHMAHGENLQATDVQMCLRTKRSWLPSGCGDRAMQSEGSVLVATVSTNYRYLKPTTAL
jgi:hypothetical protein